MERRIYIAGARVSLAEYLPDADDPANYENWQDPVMQAAYNFKMTRSYAEFQARPVRSRFLAAVVRNLDGKVMGNVSLSPEGSPPDLAIALYRPYRYQGYGPEAYSLALGHCFSTFGLEEIYAGSYPHNAASMKMLKNCGFERNPDGDCAEEHYLTGAPVVQMDHILRRSSYEKLRRARAFVSRVAELAGEMDLDYFVVTEGASGTSSRGCPAVDHARRSHVEWERAHGIDPEHDWSEEREDKNQCV